jgi:hypothetical protein
MKELIKKNIDGKKVFFLFLVTNIIYAVMLTITIPKVMSFAGGMKLLDMIPTGYTAEYVNVLLNTLGEEGRHAYLFYQIPIDMVYPLLFGVSNCLILAYFLNKLGKLNSNLLFLCFLPLFSGIFDYFENIGIITMLNSFPDNSILMSQTTNVFSVLKSLFTTIYFIVLIILLIVFGKNKIFQKNT